MSKLISIIYAELNKTFQFCETLRRSHFLVTRKQLSLRRQGRVTRRKTFSKKSLTGFFAGALLVFRQKGSIKRLFELSDLLEYPNAV